MAPQSRRYRPAIGFALLLLLVSLLPAPAARGPTPQLLGFAPDKWIHAGSYAALTALLLRGHGRRELATIALLVALAVGYGGSIELLQGLVASRSLSVADMVANTAGAVLSGLVWLMVTTRVDAHDPDDRT